jgi:hypothetical protein
MRREHKCARTCVRRARCDAFAHAGRSIAPGFDVSDQLRNERIISSDAEHGHRSQTLKASPIDMARLLLSPASLSRGAQTERFCLRRTRIPRGRAFRPTGRPADVRGPLGARTLRAHKCELCCEGPLSPPLAASFSLPALESPTLLLRARIEREESRAP